MWINNKFLKHAWDIFESWGVNFHLVLTWVKPTAIPPIPTGYKFACEFLVLGFFGKPMQKFTGRTLPNWLKCTTKRDGHSSKPNEWYDLINEKSPEPRIDIFSRALRKGFDQWGDEAANPIEQVIKNKVCSDCGYSTNKDNEFELHLTRPFHLNSIGVTVRKLHFKQRVQHEVHSSMSQMFEDL